VLVGSTEKDQHIIKELQSKLDGIEGNDESAFCTQMINKFETLKQQIENTQKRVKIKITSRTSAHISTMDVKLTKKIQSLRMTLAGTLGTSFSHVRLFHGPDELGDDHTLEHYGVVSDDSVIEFLIAL
jgi:hypothetical protein